MTTAATQPAVKALNVTQLKQSCRP